MSSVARGLVAPRARLAGVVAAVTVVAATAGWLAFRARGGASVDIPSMPSTVGDLRTLHAGVSVRGRAVRGDARLLDGDEVITSVGGRARLRLDDGTVVVVDQETRLALRGQRLELGAGRVFVQSGGAARTSVVVGDASAAVVDSAAAFAAAAGGRPASIYCARGEITTTSGGRTLHVHGGETATLGGDAKVVPETAFDDWTGGLAVPWSGERAPASAIPEVWGGARGAEPGSPLVVRSEKVGVTIEGELAITRTRTTYFNGGEGSASADVRFALPEGAIVARVARQDEGEPATHEAGLGVAGGGSLHGLEWAGGGWIRGTLQQIEGGTSVELLVDYVEWLPQRDGRATYRFPMAGGGGAPMVGGLEIAVRSQAPARWLSASAGATVSGGVLELRRADVRPTGDLVVELTPDAVRAGRARAYVERATGEDPYVVVRAEAPETPAGSGVTLALVVDASSSVGPALLETERAAVAAVLESLGPDDAVVVLAADQDTAAVGPARPARVTAELRDRIGEALAGVRPGGASNLGLALERAADVLDGEGPERAASSMVVYLGDGRPTVGETEARELRRRLSRRAGGVPRIGAFAVGQGADRWLLGELVAGAGPVYEVLDRPDAARASAALVAEALTPTVRDVAIDLGPSVDRVYPRDARTVAAGATFTVAGRLRGALPSQITLRYRRGLELVEETRPLDEIRAPAFADVARRWAELRVEDTVARDDGVEPAIALAAKAGLMTPWTGWYFDGGRGSVPFADRDLGLSPAVDTAFARRVQPAPPPPSTLVEPPAVFEGEATIEQAAIVAARHALEDSLAAMVACRDARASIKPGVGGRLAIDVAVGADGRAARVRVAASSGDDDPVLDRCVRVVVEAVPFFAAGVGVDVHHVIVLPPPRALRRSECSVASTLPLPVRRGIWRARKASRSLDYEAAARACELPTWADRRTFLGILATGVAPRAGVELVRSLAAAGDTDAAAFVRQEILHHAPPNTAAEDLRALVLGDEPRIDRVLDRAYAAARTDEQRLAVVRRFLHLAPHSPLGRRLLLGALEATGQTPALLEAIEAIRYDAFADAGLLADCASTLRRIGRADEGRRAFGELVERAPRDPWTLGYVGDRLRAEGLHEDAVATYERLEAILPGDPAVALRLALAHAGAGRLDVATRLLDRAAQTGGRGDDGRVGELASIVSAALVAGARDGATGETEALLVRRLAQTPLPDVASVILVQTPLTDARVEVLVARQAKDKDETPADLDGSALGVSAVRLERGGGTARIRLRRTGLANGRPTRGVVTALVLGGDRGRARLVRREVEVAAGDRGTELRWTGEGFE